MESINMCITGRPVEVHVGLLSDIYRRLSIPTVLEY